MKYNIEVVEVIEFSRLHFDYKVVVKAKAENGKMFNYTFIKNKKEDADAIIVGHVFEMNCKPIVC